MTSKREDVRRAGGPGWWLVWVGFWWLAVYPLSGRGDLSENFDSGTALPAGWVNGGSTAWNNAAHYSSPPYCRALAAGQSLHTPEVDFPTNLSFYVDASNKGNNRTGTVDYSVGGGGWVTLGSFVATTAGSAKNFSLAGTPNLSSTAGVRFRFNSTFSTWYLDNVVLRTANETPTNAPPFLSLEPSETNQSVLVGEEISLALLVTEVDGDELVLSATNLPDGAVFDPNPKVGQSPLSHLFSWTPAGTGTFGVVFRVEDKDGADEKTVHIQVAEPDPTILLEENFDASVSLPAGWSTGGTVNETGHFLSMPNCRAFDTGDSLITPAVDFPTNLAFYADASGNGNNQTALVEVRIGEGEWVQVGTFVVRETGRHETFSLMGLPDVSDSEAVQFRFSSTFNTWYLDDVLIRGRIVADQPPVLRAIGPQAVALGQTLTLEVAASDYDGDEISLTASNLPPGAVFAGATNAGTASSLFSYEPQESETGMVYETTFSATDIDGVSSETVSIAVYERLAGFASTAAEAWEQDGAQQVAVVLTRPGAVELDVVAGGTATPGLDYELATTHLTFTVEGGTTQYVELVILDDDRIEAAETVVLVLTNVVGAGVAGAASQVVTLRDNEAALYEPLQTNPGWSMQGQWAFGRPLGGGGGSGYPDPTSGFTGTNVYGVNLAGDYPNNLTQAHYLTTTAIDCSRFRNLRFEFQRWLGIESASFDHACVQVSMDGENWTDLWVHESQSSISDFAWTNMAFDLGAQADGQPAVQFRWGLGPTDSSVHYCGWNIDDVVVIGDAVTNAMFRFSSTGYSVVETQTEAVVSIERIGLTNAEATIVLVATGGTATAGTDYDAIEETLTFAPGERSRTFAIPVHDDADVEGDETVELSLRATATGDLAAPAETTLLVLDDESPGAVLPFFDGFESGALAAGWAQRSTEDARIRVGPGIVAPYEGTNQLCMELTNYYARGLNEAVLTVNLSGQTNVVMSFYENTLEYQHQAMPASFTGSVEADGVAVSVDGIHWLRLFDPPQYSWESYGATNRAINLSAFTAAHGLVPGPHFKIKFQHFDDLYRYGRYFDNLHLYDPTQVADVQVAVGVSEDPVEVGMGLEYVLVVSNAGPLTATGLLVSNVFPSQAGFVSVAGSQGECSRTGGVVFCALGELAPGAAATIELALTAPAFPAVLTNQAWVGGAQFDPIGTNNLADTISVADERGGTFEVAVTETGMTERDGQASIEVVRSGPTYGEISVAYATADGTAQAGADYVAAADRLVLTNGQRSAVIPILILDDELDEASEVLTLTLSDPQGGAVLGSNTTASIRIHDDDGRAPFPFLETFESGRLTNHWRTYSTGAGRIQVTSGNGPAVGAHHLTMDTSNYTGYALNELVLTADLSGQSGVTLSFWHREFNDYPHSMSNGFGGHHNADGVALSVDGQNWAKVQGLTDAEGSSNGYRRFDVLLDPVLAARGWAYSDSVQLKFQQYDCYPIPNRGFAFDDIALFSMPGELSFAQAHLEASEADGAVLITVERRNGTLGEVTVPFAAADGSAVAPGDYVPTNGILVFADGETSASFAVELVDDGDDELAETILLELGEPTGGATLAEPAQAVLTVHDNDGAGVFRFETEQVTVSESNGLVRIYVWRLEGAEGEASVEYVFSGGTAVPGLDYAGSTGAVVFADGVTSRYFTVELLDDLEMEDTETVFLQLTNPLPGAVIGVPASLVLSILDDEDPHYDYYLPVYGLGSADFRQALHDIIDGHQAFSYTPTLWAILQDADECPTNAAQVQLVYAQIGRDKNNNGAGAGQWNREHVWPQSHGAGNPYGSGDPSPTWPSSVDAHNLKPSDVAINALRGNLDFDAGGEPVAGAPATCCKTASSFEPPDEVKGDIARILFYMDVRYAGDEENEPNLVLVDSAATYGAQMGKLSTLMQWHFLDPPDAFEENRNELIYANWQGNRNPFIDHPEWALKLWEYRRTIATQAGPGGSLSPENPEVVYPSGQTFEIQPEPYWTIVDIRTNGVSVEGPYGTSAYTLVWSPLAITGALEVAFAADRAAQGTPLWWLAAHGFEEDFDLAELGDPDEDGMLTWREFLANTDPKDPLSLLQFEHVAPGPAAGDMVLRWQSASNRLYSIWRSASLPDGFAHRIVTNLPATLPVNSYTDTVDNAEALFYRIEVHPTDDPD